MEFQGKPLLPPALKKKKFDDLVDKRLEKNFDSKEMARMVSCAAKSSCPSIFFSAFLQTAVIDNDRPQTE